MAEIRVDHLHKTFGGFTAVRDSTFAVHDGEFFCLPEDGVRRLDIHLLPQALRARVGGTEGA